MTIAFAALLAFPAQAGTSSVGQITGVLPHIGGFFFNMSSTRASAPSCATANQWMINSATSQGQAMIAELLTTYTTSRRITVKGTKSCAVCADTETVGSSQLED
jgi:ammonia channel protein AmtB